MKNRKLLMIPGPIEFDPEVLAALGEPTPSHVAPEFIEVFQSALQRVRRVFQSEDGQPFILAGSGTLAMDAAGANLVEPGERALVINTGVFGERFATLLSRYGAEVTQVKAPPGQRPPLEEVENVLKSGPFKLVTVTHVDTSTGVITDIRSLAELAHRFEALLVVDGVCSVAGEELRMSEWGIDVALTASQKAIGVPPGLALVVAGPLAMQAFQARRNPVANYYADWQNWLPIMQAYEAGKPSYFGTPAVNLVTALNTSLEQILSEGLEARFARHSRISHAFKAGISALELGQVPASPEIAANTMSAIWYPPGINPGEFLSQAAEAGAFLAGGLHPEIRNQYFRVGHMGAVNASDILATMGAIESALHRSGHTFHPGAGVQAAQAVFLSERQPAPES